MGKSPRSVRTRSRTAAKPYQFVCDCPFHDDWTSPDTSRKADAVSANLFAVLSAIKQTPVLSICRACKDEARRRREVTSHALYRPPVSGGVLSLSEDQRDLVIDKRPEEEKFLALSFFVDRPLVVGKLLQLYPFLALLVGAKW